MDERIWNPYEKFLLKLSNICKKGSCNEFLTPPLIFVFNCFVNFLLTVHISCSICLPADEHQKQHTVPQLIAVTCIQTYLITPLKITQAFWSFSAKHKFILYRDRIMKHIAQHKVLTSVLELKF